MLCLFPLPSTFCSLLLPPRLSFFSLGGPQDSCLAGIRPLPLVAELKLYPARRFPAIPISDVRGLEPAIPNIPREVPSLSTVSRHRRMSAFSALFPTHCSVGQFDAIVRSRVIRAARGLGPMNVNASRSKQRGQRIIRPRQPWARPRLPLQSSRNRVPRRTTALPPQLAPVPDPSLQRCSRQICRAQTAPDERTAQPYAPEDCPRLTAHCRASASSRNRGREVGARVVLQNQSSKRKCRPARFFRQDCLFRH